MVIAEPSKQLIYLKNKTFSNWVCIIKIMYYILISRVQSTWQKNLVFHYRTKHFQIRYHFIKEFISDENLHLKNILGTKNPASMFTKVVTSKKLKFCMASTGPLDT